MSNLRAFIAAALDEDIGPGDVTTEATIRDDRRGTGTIVARQSIVVCGNEAARLVFELLGDRAHLPIAYETLIPDGARADRGGGVARIEGPLRLILTGERLALNLMMKLSGIATNTRTYVDAAGVGGPKVIDTRKTTPLLRDLEKMAVRAGGGHNHRHALYDGVLIKDNHIIAAGGIAAAVTGARAHAHHLLRIEVEVANLAELDQALDAAVDVILLDNMDDATLAAAVTRARARDPRVKFEGSGNMTPERIRAIRGLGLDFVSAGGLVHQARWVDLGLDVVAD